MRYKDIAIISATLILLGCQGKRVPGEAPGQTGREALPSQTITGFKLTETLLGRKVWVMKAEEANSFNQRKEVDLAKIEIEFYNQAGDTVTATLTSDRGRVNTEIRDMEARDNVVIISRDSVVLRTDYIRWTNSVRRLSTESKVRVERGADWLTGEGLEASPDLKEIVLKRNVKGKRELLEDLGDLR